MKFLETRDGLLAESAIVLIDDEPADHYTIHFRYTDKETRTTTAESQDVRAFLRGEATYAC